MREEHSWQREPPVQSTEVGEGQLCVPGAWWRGQGGTSRVDKGKRWDQKDNGANCQRPWGHGKRLTLPKARFWTEGWATSTVCCIYRITWFLEEKGWKQEAILAIQARDGGGLDKGGSNGYIEKWESGYILKKGAHNLLIFKCPDFYFASLGAAYSPLLAYFLSSL